MHESVQRWRRWIATCLTVIALTNLCGCMQPAASKLPPKPSTNVDSADIRKYRVDIKNADGTSSHIKAHRLEYRLNNAMIVAADDQLCADGKMVANLAETDTVTIDRVSQTVAVNGTQVWPED